MLDVMKISFVFVCPTAAYVHAMVKKFVGMPNWQFRIGVFEDQKDINTLATAGNSYGIMDGGLDLAVQNYFISDIQARVQKEIREQFSGLLPVGSAVCVSTSDPRFKRLVYVPTMRKPMTIEDTNFVFYAALALFNATKRNCKVGDVVLVPALGALTGKVSPVSMASQIHAAWIQAKSNYTFPDWEQVELLENKINPSGF